MIDETNLHTVPGGDERVLYDDSGNTYYKDPKKGIIPWAELVEDNLEHSVRSFLDLDLEDVGKIVYVRVTETGYQRIIGSERSGKAVSGQSWEDLAPELSKKRASGLAAGVSLAPTEILAVQEPEAIEIGWYQDPDGNLYQYNGDKWVDGDVSSNFIKKLEYLG
jgi:hypothetical protein